MYVCMYIYLFICPREHELDVFDSYQPAGGPHQAPVGFRLVSMLDALPNTNHLESRSVIVCATNTDVNCVAPTTTPKHVWGFYMPQIHTHKVRLTVSTYQIHLQGIYPQG